MYHDAPRPPQWAAHPPPYPAAWHGAPPVAPRVAPWGLRLVAYLVDVVLSGLLYYGLLFVTFLVAMGLELLFNADRQYGDPSPLAVAVLVAGVAAAFAGTFLYWVLPVARSGQTPGKRLAGIRIVAADTGRPPSALRALGRYLFFVLLSVPVVTFFVDCLWPLWDPRGQSLHDKVARTHVISG